MLEAAAELLRKLFQILQPACDRLPNLIRRVLLRSMVPAHGNLAERRPGAVELILLRLFRTWIGLNA